MNVLGLTCQQEPVRVVADEDNCRKKIPYLATPDDTISETYGFPPEEVSLVDENKKPLATTLLRCFPKVGVFSLRDRKWGKCRKNVLSSLWLIF